MTRKEPKIFRNKSSNDIVLKPTQEEKQQRKSTLEDEQKNIQHKEQHKISKLDKQKKNLQRATTADKENIPKNKLPDSEPVKSKMWIRPKSAQARSISIKKRNDPVALFQEYQKDWEKFKNNIPGNSRSELRWHVREKLLTDH